MIWMTPLAAHIAQLHLKRRDSAALDEAIKLARAKQEIERGVAIAENFKARMAGECAREDRIEACRQNIFKIERQRKGLTP